MSRIALLAFFLVSNPAAQTSNHEPDREIDFFPREHTEAQRTLLLGKWKGERILDGKKSTWFVTHDPDGTYVIEFHTVKPSGESKTFMEYGRWGVRKPIYFIAKLGAIEDDARVPYDTSYAELYDAYRIDDLDSSAFYYTSYTSGTSFLMKKVPED